MATTYASAVSTSGFIGRTYRLKADHTIHLNLKGTSFSGLPSIQLRQGDTGAILDPNKYDMVCDQKSFCISMPKGRHPLPACKIDRCQVEVGHATVGQISLDIDVAPKDIWMPMDARWEYNDRLKTTLSHFLHSVASNNDIHPYIQNCYRTATTQQLNNTVNVICKGIGQIKSMQLYNLLAQHNDWSIKDIMRIAPVVNSSTNKVGIYIIVHAYEGKYKIYVGKSINVGRRWDQHKLEGDKARKEKQKKHTPHYTSWAAGGEQTMYLLCDLPSNTEANSAEMTLAELFFVVMAFESYLGYLTSKSAQAFAKIDMFALKDEDAQVLDDVSPSVVLPEQAGSNILPLTDFGTRPRGPQLDGKRVTYSAIARLMKTIAEAVKETTKWPGGISRSSFGVHDGLNVATPFTRNEPSLQPVHYAAVTFEDRTVYTRSVQTVLANGASSMVLFFMRRTCIWTRNIEPSVGTKVYTIIEIMHNDQPHPQGFGRLPDSAGTTDWNTARSLGIKLVWRDSVTRQWKFRPLQSCLSGQTSHGRPLASYIECMAIVRSLRQQKLKGQAGVDFPRWLDLHAPAPVVRLTFDWFTQTLSMRGKSTITEVEAGRQIPAEDRTRLLIRRFGVQNAGMPFSVFEIRNWACDLCQALRANAKSGRDAASPSADRCEQDEVSRRSPGTDCKQCAKYGIQCTFTTWTAAQQQPGGVREQFINYVRHKERLQDAIAIDIGPYQMTFRPDQV